MKYPQNNYTEEKSLCNTKLWINPAKNFCEGHGMLPKIVKNKNLRHKQQNSILNLIKIIFLCNKKECYPKKPDSNRTYDTYSK